MARKPRFNLPGIPQHVIQRGNDRQACFYTPVDYLHYLRLLGEEAVACACDIHAYVLMTNHVHLLVTPNVDHGISRMMQRLGTRYVRYINQTYQRTGTLWEGRFKSCLVGSERYLLNCYQYIELNPVRAGMVRTPDEYEYSSYLANACGRTHPLLMPHSVYLSLGATPGERCHAYQALFRDVLEAEDLQNIRAAVNQELIYGNDRFKTRIEAMTSRSVRTGRAGRPLLTEDKKLY